MLEKSKLTIQLAKASGLTVGQVSDVMNALHNIMREAISKAGPGEFTFYNLLKIIRWTRKPLGERTGYNFKTGKRDVFAPIGSKDHIRINPLKSLKEMK